MALLAEKRAGRRPIPEKWHFVVADPPESALLGDSFASVGDGLRFYP